jgi:ribosomal protein S14
MSLALAVTNLADTALSQQINTAAVRCHRLGQQIWFAEKLRISRHQLQLMALEAKLRQEERELQVAVTDCQALIHNLLASSLENAQKRVKSFAVDLMTGKEAYRAESIGRRIISQREINNILAVASLQISKTWEIPLEPVSKALLGTADITAYSPIRSAKMIAQYKTTAAVSEAVNQAVQIACEKSLDAISPHWIVKETLGNFNIAAAILKATDCHPVAQQQRCIADIEKCIDGMLTNVYYQLSRRCTKQIAHVLYSLYQPTLELSCRRLYLVSKAM